MNISQVRNGQRGFAVANPATWNSLPLTVRDKSLTGAVQDPATNLEVNHVRAYGE